MADSKSTHEVVLTATDRASAVVRGLENRFNTLGSVIGKTLGVIGVAGVASLTGALVKGVKEAAAEEQIMRRLQTAVEKTGRSYTTVSGEVNNLLKSQQRLTQFADDQSASALATLIQLTQDYSLSMRALVVTEDLAASGLFDLDSAATAVGKALSGNTMILQRMGIQIKQGDDVLAKLSERFGGTAVKNVDTFSGRLTQLRNIISDTFETLGGPLLDPLKRSMEQLRDTIGSPEIQQRISQFAQSIAEKIPDAVRKLTEFSRWVIDNGDKILTFFKALIALKITSWALSTASSLIQLAPLISKAIAAAISPAGLIVLAAASGTTIGLTIGNAIADAIRNSRVQQAIPDVLNDFVGPPAAKKFPLVGSGLDPKNLGNKVAEAGDVLVSVILDLASRIRRVDMNGRGPSIYGLEDATQDLRLGRPWSETQAPPMRRMPITENPGITRHRELSSEFSSRTEAAEKAWGDFQQRVMMVASYTNSAMLALTSTLVRGIESGTLKIKDLFNSLKSAILSIIADLLAKLATAGILSIFFPSLGIAGALSGMFGGGFQRTNSMPVRPAPVGALPINSTSGFGGRPVTVNIYGSGQIHNISDLERELAGRIQRGQSRLNKFIA